MDRWSREREMMRQITRRADVRQVKSSGSNKGPTVEIVIASDSPVERWDEDRGEQVQEILLMDGVEFRTEQKQLPIVDSHDRSTVRNVLGSVRNVRVENGQLVGRAVFASDEDSQRAYKKLTEGHLTDFSVTATPKEIKKIPRGQTVKVNGHTLEGPVDLVTRWMVTDASLVGVGADVNSRVRTINRALKSLKRGDVMPMDDETKEKLVQHGMPEDLVEDDERALEWMLQRVAGDEEEEEDIEFGDDDEGDMDMEEADELKKCRDFYSKKRAKGKEDMEEEIEFGDEDEDDEKKVGVAVERALRQDRKRRSEIKAICRSANIPRGAATRYADSGMSSKQVKRKVLRQMANKPVGRVQVKGDSQIERNLDMRDAMIMRSDPSFKGRKGCSKLSTRNVVKDGRRGYSRRRREHLANEWNADCTDCNEPPSNN